MSREYLKTLNDKIFVNPSEIKLFIEDIPKISDTMIFSNLQEVEDREMFCNVINTLLKRISISARRSKQAFTSMWDNLRKFLELLLNDALKIEKRSENLNKIIRQILQLGIKPDGQWIYCDCNWLAMDLDTQIGKIFYSNGIKHLDLIESDLNLKTLSLFVEKFDVFDFPKTFLKISNPNPTIIDLFFNKKYYDYQVMVEYIKARDVIPLEIIINLKNLPINELIKFPFDIIELLITKIKPLLSIGTSKEQLAVFELLTEISDSLTYRSNDNLIKTLSVIVNNYDFSLCISDSVLSKYWSFVSSILSSSEHVELNSSLESKIIQTIKADLMLKSKISVCRIISLYWRKINDKSGLLDLLLTCAKSNNSNNKLKWNIAVAMMNYKCPNLDDFSIAKIIWLDEIRKNTNYKVMYSWTNLLLNWSVLYQYDLLCCYDDEITIWACLNHLKSFINENSLNLECEDGENIVESANKLELVLKSILIGPNFKGD